MKYKFPVIKAGTISHNIKIDISRDLKIIKKEIEIHYPARLEAMSANPAGLCYNKKLSFSPGEIFFSIERFVKTKVKVKNKNGGKLFILKDTKRKVLVKHAYLLMCKLLKVTPSLEISVDESELLKHCGFCSSGVIIASVAVAINELYGNPLDSETIIKFISKNHAEEVEDDNENELKIVQSIGGGVSSGLYNASIMIIAGEATVVSKTKYDAEILIAIPNDYVEKDAKLLMELEEKNLYKFKRIGKKYSKDIAFRLFHSVLPDLTNGNIKELSKLIFDYRFKMGSIKACSFVYDKLVDYSRQIEKLYENKHCELAGMSSVGPAFYLIVKNKSQKNYCKKNLEKQGMSFIETKLYNNKYKVK